MKLILVVDGASHNNGDVCGTAYILYTETGEKLLKSSRFCGKGDNMFAEYQAMIDGITGMIGYMQEHENEEIDLTILTDSNVVVSQMNGTFKTRTSETQRYIAEIMSDIDELKEWVKSVNIEHVPREFTAEVNDLAQAETKNASLEETKEKYSFLVK